MYDSKLDQFSSRMAGLAEALRVSESPVVVTPEVLAEVVEAIGNWVSDLA